LDYSYTTTVKDLIFTWNGNIGMAPPPMGRTITALTIIYTMWGVWKERNGRVFRNVAMLPELVATLVKEEASQMAYTHTQDLVDTLFFNLWLCNFVFKPPSCV
jgi:hypothetical protein